MNSPQPSPQALLETLNISRDRFVANLLAALPANQGFDGVETFRALISELAHDSERWTKIQNCYYQRHLELWMALAHSDATSPPAPIVEPEKGDRRFLAPEWRQLPYFAYLMQAYLLNSRWLLELVETAELDTKTRNKLRFYTRQVIDAAAPSNFAATNPEVFKVAAATHGDSLKHGLEQLREDAKKGRLSTTDESAFEVGRNIAVTPGTVIFENELIQLIQYAPGTRTVHERPLLMVPPFINKYYVLDLQPENSLARFAVSQGHTVFMVSWRNVARDMGHFTWDDYLASGVIKAIEVAREIGKARQINALGFCVGGTLLACSLAVLRGKRRNPVSSVTLLASMLDFSDTGELSVFVDAAYVTQREQEFAQGGIMRGRQLERTFASLRANDLIWNYVVNNYLKGRKPHAFDLLHWNSDCTNLPGAMFAYYLRNMYLENSLRVPSRLTMCGVPVDLSKVAMPAFVLASHEDHIVPWKTAYQSTQLLGGNIEFVLGASGHVAGIVNPASKNKRHHSLNPDLPASADIWLAGAQQKPGSWWNHWSQWIAGHGGARVPARRQAGNPNYPGIEPAPGRYVRQACD